MGKKKLWECPECGRIEMVSKANRPLKCFCGDEMFKVKKKKKKKKKSSPSLNAFLEFVNGLNDSDVYGDREEIDDASVCGCVDGYNQVCDICQGVYPFGDKELDNIECNVCHDFKHPDKIMDNGACSVCQEPEDDEPEKVIDGYYYFEIMDRLTVIQSNIEDFIGEHPTLNTGDTNEDMIKGKIDKVQNLLSDVYQWAGHKFSTFEDDK